jgi:hypothetical protein
MCTYTTAHQHSMSNRSITVHLLNQSLTLDIMHSIGLESCDTISRCATMCRSVLHCNATVRQQVLSIRVATVPMHLELLRYNQRHCCDIDLSAVLNYTLPSTATRTTTTTTTTTTSRGPLLPVCSKNNLWYDFGTLAHDPYLTILLNAYCVSCSDAQLSTIGHVRFISVATERLLCFAMSKPTIHRRVLALHATLIEIAIASRTCIAWRIDAIV